MRLFYKLSSIFLSLIFTLSLCACKDKGSVLDFTCFNTYVHVQTHSTVISNKTQNQLKELFAQLELEFSANNQTSLVNKFNNANSGEQFSLDEHAQKVFSFVKNAHAFTDGLYDPTVYNLVKLWGFAPYKNTLSFTPPESEQIKQALSTVNFNGLNFDADNKTITKTDDNIKIDLGGIVKGYAADIAMEILLNAGHHDGYVSVGGSSLSLLNVDRLGIRHPRKTAGNSIITANVSGKTFLSVSTSGDYEKYYKDKGGNKFCHIINPKTGYPANTGVASVSILGVDGTMGDALTTAACLKTVNFVQVENSELALFLQKIITHYPDCWVFAVCENQTQKLILTNKHQGEDFTLNDISYTVKNL